MPIIELRVPRDPSFKRFVHNQTFIRHLLRAHPLDGLDESEIVAVDSARGNLVGPDMPQRLADAMWRLKLADGSIVYLLVECQAEIDPTMPFRMLHAVATMYLVLSNEPLREMGYSASAVPRVKHLTIYSGPRPWSAVGAVEQAITIWDDDAERDIPRMACPVLDLRRFPDPGGEGNVAVLLGRLQRCESPEELLAAAQPLQKWSASAEYAALASAFAHWISDVRIPDLGVLDALKSDNLKEVLDMLEAETLTWADRMRDEGRLAGERKLLLRLARARFGEPLASRLSTALEGIADGSRLEEIGEWLLVCESGDALLARLGQH